MSRLDWQRPLRDQGHFQENVVAKLSIDGLDGIVGFGMSCIPLLDLSEQEPS